MRCLITGRPPFLLSSAVAGDPNIAAIKFGRIKPSVLSLALCIVAIAFHSEALAQDQPTTPISAATFSAKIAEFNATLESARRTQDDLKPRVQCLENNVLNLQEQRKEQELKLGPMKVREEELKISADTQKAILNGFRATADTEQAKVAQLTALLNQLEAAKQAQEDWIAKCEREKPAKHLLGASCRFDMNVSTTVGYIKDCKGDIEATKKRLATGNGSLEDAKARAQESQLELDRIKNQLANLMSHIGNTEYWIKATAALLSANREAIGALRIAIDELANALTEANGINQEDARPRTLRKLSDISGQIDAAMSRSADAIARTNQAFGADWLTRCTTKTTASAWRQTGAVAAEVTGK